MSRPLHRYVAALIWCVIALSILAPQISRADWSQEYPISKIYGDVTCVARYNGDVIVGGFFTFINGKDLASIARWDGSSWTSMGAGFTYQGGTAWIRDLIVYDGKLIAAGTFDLIDGIPTSGIAMWDGIEWKDMEGGIGPSFSGGHPAVSALMIYAGDLVAGGNCLNLGGALTNNGGRWDGAPWNKYGSGTPQIVHCLTEFQGGLYAGGAITNPDPILGNAVWRWTGSGWSAITLDGVGIGVFALAEYNGSLIAGGVAFYVGAELAIKIGNQWYEYADGIAYNSSVYDLDVIDGDLVVAGEFAYVGNDPTNVALSIARWDGVNWHDLDYGLHRYNNWERVYQVVPDSDSFFAAGVFSFAGNNPATTIPSLATWTDISIKPKPVTAQQIPDFFGGYGATWIFTWKTNHDSDPLLDEVIVRDYAHTSPSCMIGQQTFHHNGSSVIAKVTLQTDGWYLHEMTVDRRECAPGCDYLFDVSSTAWGYTASVTDKVWNTGYCISNPKFSPENDGATTVSRTNLEQNHPNPFNPSTVIGYSIADGANVTLAVYDVSGKLVRTLVNEHQGQNHYQVTWDGRNNAGMAVASGAYFYRLETPTYSETKKLLLLK